MMWSCKVGRKGREGEGEGERGSEGYDQKRGTNKGLGEKSKLRAGRLG